MMVSSQFTVDSLPRATCGERSRTKSRGSQLKNKLCHSERSRRRSEESKYLDSSASLRPQNDKRYCLAAFVALFAMTAASAFALEMPDEARGYYKDRVSSAPGHSEGVGPTVEQAQAIEGVDIGRRETAEYDFSDESSFALTVKSWEALNKKDEQALLAYTSRCIELYTEEARDQQAKLSDFAPAGSEAINESLNNVAVCYFMLGEFYKHQKDWDRSRENYQKVRDNFYFAQYWDPRGWWWKPGEISKGEVEKIDEGYYEKD